MNQPDLLKLADKLGALHTLLRALTTKPEGTDAVARAPIDMVLHCPACGLQHIDEADDIDIMQGLGWSNPPHRSHLCSGCDHIWRPADVATNGVAAVKTKGKADLPIAAAPQEAQPSEAYKFEQSVAAIQNMEPDELNALIESTQASDAEDAARLDWMEKVNPVVFKLWEGDLWELVTSEDSFSAETLRAAIDAARRNGGQG